MLLLAQIIRLLNTFKKLAQLSLFAILKIEKFNVSEATQDYG